MPFVQPPLSNSHSLQIVQSLVDEEKIEDDLGKSVLLGLSQKNKTLPCQFFYDQSGSEIFEKITELPEYYPTRCERQILIDFSDEIAGICDQKTVVVELGSGSSSKTRTLLEAFIRKNGQVWYVPIDISAKFLESTSKDLLQFYPNDTLRITAVPGLYQNGLCYIKESQEFHNSNKLVCFFGSSIGNFTRSEAKAFLREIRGAMGPKDKLLIGIDLKKDISVLEAAYNDAQGVTADFNLNLLHRINKELGADFQVDQFEHKSVWNEEEGRIEMRIYSKEDQTVAIPAIQTTVSFAKGEFIHTENCYKYSHQDIEALANDSGFSIEKIWLDKTKQFSLSIFKQELLSTKTE